MRRLALLLLLLGGCDLSMRDQPKGHAQQAAELWPGGPPRAAAPEGAVAMDQGARNATLTTAPPLTLALLDRGQARYAIDCAVCHGARGAGDGSVVKRGFPAPRPFSDPAVAAETPAEVVAVIGAGKGLMYGFADRIDPADRWAIAAYVAALARVPAQ